MELWLDTVDIDAIRNATELGMLTGVTTNPSLLSKANTLPEIVLKEIVSAQPGYVAIQVVAQDLVGMINEAKRLAEFSDRIIIKIPVTAIGLKAMTTLARENIATMATAIYDASQVLLSVYAGAKYAAFYLSKVEEVDGNAFEVLQEIMEILMKQNSPLKLLAASISLTSQVVTCARMGVHAITLPKQVYVSLLETHKLTDRSLAKFQEEWLEGKFTAKSQLF